MKFFSVLVTALVAYATAPAQTTFRGNPNILVPSSSRRQPPGYMRTHYLSYQGPWNRVSGDDPVAMLLGKGGPALVNPPGYHPVDLRNAYKISSGRGQDAICIVDAFDLPTSLKDFNTFSAQYGLPIETSTDPMATTNKVFQLVYSNGNKPMRNASWGAEIALDIEWAHAMAPNAKIYLVETPSNQQVHLQTGVLVGSTLPGVRQISMSWGGAEFDGEAIYETLFNLQGVTYFCSTGDIGGVPEYPAILPSVCAVGGTTLDVQAGVFQNETGWSGSGGGPSQFIPRPDYQDSVSAMVGEFRGTPDVSAVADPATGCSVYISTPDDQFQTGWVVYGGTSLATPVVAGITNSRGYFPQTTRGELRRQYLFPSWSHLYQRDVVTGASSQGDTTIFNCGTGYDFVTGLGALTRLLPAPVKISTFLPKTIDPNPAGTQPFEGSLAELRSADSTFYKFKRSSNGVGGIESRFQIYYPCAAYQATTGKMVVTLQGMASTAIATTMKVWNYYNREWDSVSTFSLTKTNAILDVDIPKPENHIDLLDGTSRVWLQCNGMGSGTVISLDQLKIVASPAP